MENPNPKLPQDIVADILSRLPVKSLTRFRCVSKPWSSLISNPQFIQKHLNRSINSQRLLISTYPLQSIDYKADDDDESASVMFEYPVREPVSGIELVGSCNGLICLVYDSDSIILWNPSIRDAKELPKSSFVSDCVFNYGLGYDSSIDDYKVVRIVSPAISNVLGKTQIEIFTLKTNSWRVIQDIHFSSSLSGSGIFFNGVLHWLLRHGVGPDIVCFDLETEALQNLVPLPDLDFGNFAPTELTVFGGYLAIVCYYRRLYFDIWVMKDYGVKASWTKLVTINCDTTPPYEDWLLPLCFSKNDEVLMDVDGRGLIMYNLKDETFRNLNIRGEWDWFETVIYVESLVSPNCDEGIDG